MTADDSGYAKDTSTLNMVVEPPPGHQSLEGSMHQSYKTDRKKLTLVFASMCLMNFGSAFIWDFPSIFTDQLITELNLTTYHVSWLYIVYSIPNFVMTPLGSLILNKIGLGMGCIYITAFVAVSIVLFGFGTQYKSFYLLLAARAVYGVGGEMLLICQTTVAEKWFTGKFLSIAIGCNTFMTFFAAAISANVSPRLYTISSSFKTPVLGGIAATVLSLIAALVYKFVEDSSPFK